MMNNENMTSLKGMWSLCIIYLCIHGFFISVLLILANWYKYNQYNKEKNEGNQYKKLEYMHLSQDFPDLSI